MGNMSREKENEQSDLLEYCPAALNRLLVDIVDMVIVILDEDLRVQKYNRYFANMIAHPQGEIEGLAFDKLLEQDGELKLPLQGGERRQNLKFNREKIRKEKLAGSPFSCQIIREDDWYLLAGRPQLPEREEYFEKLTKLNNELVNKARELTKKNVELEKARSRIEELLRTDDLTGISNRRAFMEFFEKIFSLSRRHSSSLSLVMIDLDNFKEINDSFGHQTGDKVLIKTGELLADNVRQEDMAARIGGDEFSVLLPETSQKEAVDFARRLRVKIEEIKLEGVSHRLSASFGVAELGEEESRKEFMQRADENLYKAKNSGKDGVGITPEDERKGEI